MKNGPFERPLFVYMRCDFVILSFDLFSHLNVHDLLINVLWFLLDGNRFVSIKIGIAFHSHFEWMDLLHFQFVLPAPNECDYIVRVHIGYFIFFCSSKTLCMPIHTWNWSHLVRTEPNETTRHEFLCNYRIWAYFNSPLHKTGQTNIKSEWKPKNVLPITLVWSEEKSRSLLSLFCVFKPNVLSSYCNCWILFLFWV